MKKKLKEKEKKRKIIKETSPWRDNEDALLNKAMKKFPVFYNYIIGW